jgi:hypothetical protein
MHLPNFLKKTYINPLNPSLWKEINSALSKETVLSGTISNQWVSDTPSEFRKTLAEAFNLGIIKREILNLASSATKSVSTNEELIEDLSEDSIQE